MIIQRSSFEEAVDAIVRDIERSQSMGDDIIEHIEAIAADTRLKSPGVPVKLIETAVCITIGVCCDREGSFDAALERYRRDRCPEKADD